MINVRLKLIHNGIATNQNLSSLWADFHLPQRPAIKNSTTIEIAFTVRIFGGCAATQQPMQ